MPPASNASCLDVDDALALVEAVRRAALTGLAWDLASTDLPSRQYASGGGAWGFGRRIPADLIRHVLLTTNLGPDPRGLRLIGASITGTLDLSHATVPCPLILERCYFENNLLLEGTTLPALSLLGSHTPGLGLDGAHVGGVTNLSNLRSTGQIRAIGAHITGQLNLTDAILRNYAGISLILDGAHIDSGAIFTGLRSSGEVRAPSAHITGHLSLTDAKLKNSNGSALNLDGAHIDGGVNLTNLRSNGQVSAIGAHITGQLNFTNAALRNPGGIALGLDGARIENSVFLRVLRATGEVRAVGVHITGAFDSTDAVLENPGGFALILDGARIDSGTRLTHLQATGQVRASGAHIAGYLDLTDAILKNYDDTALRLDGARIDGGATLVRLIATGQVRASSAHIAGYLDLTDAILKNYDDTALRLDGARIDGGATLVRLIATGQVRASGTHVTGYLNLRPVTIKGSRGNFFGQTIKVGSLIIGKNSEIDGKVNLVRATIGDLVIDDTFLRGQLDAKGWSVKDILHSNPLTPEFSSKKIVTRWLETTKIFAAQPWHEVADVFERKGQPAQARALRLEAARRTTRQSPRRSRPLLWAYDLLMGHGYWPGLPAVWLLAAVALAMGLTSWQAASFLPNNPSALQAGLSVASAERGPASGPERPQLNASEIKGTTSCAALDKIYPCLNPLQYGFDVVLPPTLSTGQASTWRTTSAWLPTVFQALRVFAWLLITLLVAGVTGLLRKT